MSDEEQAKVGEEGAGDSEDSQDQEQEKSQEDQKAAGKAAAEDEDSEKKAATIASGKEERAEEKKPPYWPEDWQEKVARHYAGDDEKAYKRELKRLKRVNDPTGIYGNFRELEAKFSEGGLVKVPGKDAKEEDVAAFNKALGVPEKPEEYFEQISLENGAIIGDADKPLADSFAAAMHKASATPQAVSAGVNWYFANKEEQAAALDEADDVFRLESSNALKEEYGPAFRRYTNAIATLFNTAPGGTDVNSSEALVSRVLAGRTADGKKIGDDPDVIRWLVGLAREVRPIASVTEQGAQTGTNIDAEIAAIEKRMKEDRRAYFKDEAAQARYRELIEARSADRARKVA